MQTHLHQTENHRNCSFFVKHTLPRFVCIQNHIIFISLQGDRLRTTLLALYFNAHELPLRSKVSKKESQTDQTSGIFLFRANKSLYDMQCMMDLNGATDLVIDLIMAAPSPNIFLESIQLAIALLDGGNGTVQVSCNEPCCLVT